MLKVKYRPNDSIKKYKEQQVAQSFTQIYGIDYTEIFVSTIRRELLRIFLAIAIMLEMIILHMDVIGTYLKSSFGQNKHLIYMKVPQRCKTG